MSSFDLRHPENDLLLQYLDGELPARKARQVRKHVEACWQCRSELDELQKTVGECVRYRRDLLQSSLPPPPAPWQDLSREFARLDSSEERSGLFRRPVIRWTALAAAAVSLAAATFTLRMTVFRPSEDRIQVTGAQPVESKVLPQPETSPARTKARADGPAPSVPGPLPVPPAEPAPLASLADALQAVAALHQLGADLGEPVEVAREGAHVVVSGTGVSPALQTQIRSALVAVPNVVVRFVEPAAAPVEPVSPVGNDDATGAGAPRIPSRLETQLGGRTQLESFSSQLLGRDEAAMARAYALRRLAQQFPAEAERQLSNGDLRLLKNLGREHVAALAREVAAIDRTASPVLASMGAGAPPRPSRSDALTWQAAAENLFRSASQVETLLAALLGATAPDRPANNLPAQLASSVAQLEADVQQCERLLTQ
jgi:hypothetical protein